MVGIDGSIQTNAWAIPSATRIILEGLKLYKIVPKKYRRKWLLTGSCTYDKKRDVPLVSGAGMMVERDLINKLGAFDSNLFMYGEDIEWCLRIRQNGWRIISDPNAEIIHLGGQSAVQVWSKRELRIRERGSIFEVSIKLLLTV